MVKRLILGKRGSDYGFWVSKPGVDVDAAGRGDMLWNMGDRMIAPVAQGVFDAKSLNYEETVTVPDIGAKPLVHIWPLQSNSGNDSQDTLKFTHVRVHYISNTQFVIRCTYYVAATNNLGFIWSWAALTVPLDDLL